jgi:hypothetical protein
VESHRCEVLGTTAEPGRYFLWRQATDVGDAAAYLGELGVVLVKWLIIWPYS